MNRNLAGLASPDEMEDEEDEQDKPVHYRLSETNRVSERRETTEGGSLKSQIVCNKRELAIAQ